MTVNGAVTVTGSVDATLADSTIQGTVAVSSLPEVTLSDTTMTVNGAVTVSGTVSATLTDSGINDAGGSLTVDFTAPDTTIQDGGGSITTDRADIANSFLIVDLALTDTGTVYSYTLPAKCIDFELEARGVGVVDWSNSDTTAATTYKTLKSGYPYTTFGKGAENLYSGTLYFKCPLTANEVMEIIVWTKP
jgi:hypothetical protein